MSVHLLFSPLGVRDSNPICLKLVKFTFFLLVVLERRQPIFVLRTKILSNFPAFKVEEFQNEEFCHKTKKIQE